MKLTFCGGAGNVTGSNYLLESSGYKILIDCGLEQGSRYAEKRNFEPFSYEPKSIRAVFITHAHLDHTGRLPKLFADGFRGIIYSTPPTKDSAELILLDSEHILNKEAEQEGRPLFYTSENIDGVLKSWTKVPYHNPIVTGPFEVELYDAGHILGSAFIRVKAEGKTIVFSGDLGNNPPPIIKPTEPMPFADYCLIESTYGDRIHNAPGQRREDLEDIIEDTAKKGGTLMIPAFAMERTQDLLYNLHELFAQGRVPRIPVFIDSPLAIKITAVYKKYENYFGTETRTVVRSGDDILNFPGLHLTLTTEQSKEINDAKPPKIIIAGSGMSNGGRILHHEMRYLPDAKNTILFVGYQSAGTLGRSILDGARTVHIFQEEVPVRCSVRTITAYSAHADQPQLLSWLKPVKDSLKKAFVVQGEETSSRALGQKIRDDLAIEAVIPKQGDEVVL